MTTDIGPISYLRSFILGDDPSDPGTDGGLLPMQDGGSTATGGARDAGIQAPLSPLTPSVGAARSDSVDDILQKTHNNLPLTPETGAAFVVEVNEATPRAATVALPEIDRTRLSVSIPPSSAKWEVDRDFNAIDHVPTDKLIEAKTPTFSTNLPLPPSPMPPSPSPSGIGIGMSTDMAAHGMDQVRSNVVAALKEQGLGEGLTKPQSLHVQEELDKLSEMFPDMDRNSIKDFIKDHLKGDLEEEGEATFS